MSFHPPCRLRARFQTNRGSARNYGFTLVEVLIAISVVLVLAALLFFVTKGVMGTVNTSNCSTRLRQVGVAIHAYAVDHGNTLPGPMTSQTIFPLYRDVPNHENKDNGVFYYIWPYLGLDPTGTVPRLVRVGVCPLAERGKSQSYLMNSKFFTTSVHRSSSTPVRYPYPNLAELPPESDTLGRGYPLGYISTLHGVNLLPWKVSAVPSPAKLALLGEMPGNPDNPNTYNTPLPPDPGQHCNFLFLDGHVETTTQGVFMTP